MKKLDIVFFAAFVILVSILAFACAEKYECKSGSTSCGSFEACCTSSDCYYNYNGKKYQCNGTDCNQAAKDLAAVMCGTSGKVDSEPVSESEKQLANKILLVMKEKQPCSSCP